MRVATAMIRLTSRKEEWLIPNWVRTLQDEYGVDWYDPNVRAELHRLREMGVINLTLKTISMEK